jgi:alpha-glucosidase
MSPRLVRHVLTIAFLVLVPAVAPAQWASVGDVPAPRREGNTLTFRAPHGVAAVTALSPEVVRVRYAPARDFGRDHSYAVVSRDLGDPGARFDVSAASSTITTSALRVTVRHRPFRIAFADAQGRSLDEDDPAMGIARSGPSVKVHKRLRDDEMVYGFGEKTGRLNRRGWWLGGYSFTMWNTDAGGYDGGTDPLYASFPFFIVMRGGRAHGIFLDNTWRTNFDVGKQWRQILSFGAEGGELDYYFIDGPDPKQVIERYARLTGRMPLPPMWSLGFHQCRYSYYPESRVRFIADNFRHRRIPADVLWLDIHYLDGYNPFTWDKERFPDPAGFIGDLRGQGFHIVTIIDPHPKKQPGWDVYDTGVAGDHFIKNPDGSIYEAPVWPANAERDPAPSVFPDFSRPATRQWWGGLYKRLTDIGVSGIWNDMNEPAIFVAPTWTMKIDVRHDNEGQPTDHREIHNVWGMLMTRGTVEGLTSLRPDERPFVLTRATFSGGQRYAALWPGDNLSRWEDLRASLPMLMSLGLSGMPFVGSDIGGFGESATAELFTRWIQAGIFYPFMRVHTAIGTADQEPWSYGTVHEAINRRAIELRYELLPHIYNEMRRSSQTGLPAFRPLLLEFPDDDHTWGLDDQYMFGTDVLAAPVVFEAHRERELYLPKGVWFDFWTGIRYEGERRITVPVTLESIPLFVRAGAFIYRQPVIQHTGEMPGQPLRVVVYPADASSSSLYEDDGLTMQYRQGASLERAFTQERDEAAGRIVVEVGKAEGNYRPKTRALELHVHAGGLGPRTVRVESGGSAASDLRRVDSLDDLAGQDTGWTMAGPFVVVKQPDRFDGLRVIVER